MVDKDMVLARLKLLNGYVSDLREVQAASLERYAADKYLNRFAEHTLQMAIECCLDIGHHIIADEGWRMPDEYHEVFVVLVDEGVLPRSLLPNFQGMARFRNLLVHNYAEVDHARVYDILQNRLGDFDAFAHGVLAHLGK